MYSEAIQELEVYSDPDVHIYDPMPSESIIKRARFAARAAEWCKITHSWEGDILPKGRNNVIPSSAAEYLVVATDPDVHFGDWKRVLPEHGAVIASIQSHQLAQAAIEMYQLKHDWLAIPLTLVDRSSMSVVQLAFAEREIDRASSIGSFLGCEEYGTSDPIFCSIGTCSKDLEDFVTELEPVVAKHAAPHSASPSKPQKKRYVQEHSDLVVLFMIARDLEKIGRDYPKALPESERKRFLDKVLIHANGILGLPHFQETKDLLESADIAKETPAHRYGITMSTLLVGHPEYVVSIEGDGQSQFREEIEKVMSICQNSASPKVDKMKASLATIMVISCRMPEDKKNKEFSETARFFQMLQHYWPLALRLIQIQTEGVGFQPHPLLDFIVNLQDRLQTCFSSLPSDSETKIAHEACSALMEVMVDGEIDDLSAVPEWTNGEILKINTFIAKMRMRMGTREYELTCAEEYFVKHVGHQIDKYKKQTISAWEAMQKRADTINQTNKENDLSQSGQNRESNHASHDDSSGMESETSMTPKKSVGLKQVADDEKVDAVVLGKSKGDPCMVLGKEKPALTDGQHAVIEALLEAGDNGMSKDPLEAVRSSALRMLRNLRNDCDWEKVIQMAGKTNGRYRIKRQSSSSS